MKLESDGALKSSESKCGGEVAGGTGEETPVMTDTDAVGWAAGSGARDTWRREGAAGGRGVGGGGE